MADRFEELRTFVAVAEAGGVTAAAARLGLAKSAVSRRISELEKRLGVDLLSRETRRFTLTPAGFAHHAKAKALLAALDELDRSTAEGEQVRPLTVSAPLELAIHVVAPALAALAGRGSGIAFRLSTDDAKADVAIAISLASGRRKIEGEIGRTESVRYAAPSPGDTPPSAARTIEVASPPSWFEGANATAVNAVSTVVGTLDMAMAAAIGGAGAATLPDFMAADAVARGKLTRLTDQPPGPAATITATVATGIDASELVTELERRLRLS